MRRTASLVSCTLAALLLMGAFATSAGAAPSKKTVDECKLLTTKQAAVIMQTEPYSDGSPDNDGCSWETDPTDRANGFAYVTVTVEALKAFLGSHPDVRTAIDESTNVGIDPLPGVGSEAYSTYSPLSGPGTADGFTVRVGKQVLEIGVRPVTSIENPSPELDQVVKIVKKMVAKVKSS